MTQHPSPDSGTWYRPEGQFWEDKTFSMRDRHGFPLAFFQPVEEVSMNDIKQRHQEARSSARFEGLLIVESLKDTGVLDDLQITRTEVWDVQGGASLQPSTWTAVWFAERPHLREGDERCADAVAEKLSGSLLADWYCNIATERHSFVVFGGRVFKYPRGDERGRAEAQAYGRSLGLPEKQLDWGEDYPLIE